MATGKEALPYYVRGETTVNDRGLYKIVTDPTLTFQSKLYLSGHISLYVNDGCELLGLDEVFSVTKIDDLITHLNKLREISNNEQ